MLQKPKKNEVYRWIVGKAFFKLDPNVFSADRYFGQISFFFIPRDELFIFVPLWIAYLHCQWHDAVIGKIFPSMP